MVLRTSKLSGRSGLDGFAEADVQITALAAIYSPDPTIAGKTFVVSRPMTIGRRERDSDADLQISDRRISRRHAGLQPRPGGAVVEYEDLGSTNGSFVEGRPFSTGRVALGSVLRIGDTVFEVTRPPGAGASAPYLIGQSHRFSEAIREVEAAVETGLSVLLLGETGSGKELFARYVHERSGRKGEFVSINCASIPSELMESALFGHKRGSFTGATADADGYFTRAQGGSLFLDEVSELRTALQAKLLRVLETREYSPVGSTALMKADVRVISATNVDLRSETIAGTFRKDLFARLTGYTVRLPSLRQRRSDIPLIARHFLALYAPHVPLEWSAGFAENLVLYDWPLNIRELRATIQRLAPRLRDGTRLTRQLLEHALQRPEQSDFKDTTTSANDLAGAPSRRELESLLQQFNGNVSELAEHYLKDRKQVYRWLRRYRLDPQLYRAD